jgi:glycosyltransferase involved in cell wall biosynthesis
MPRLLVLCEYPTLLGGERSMLATLPTVAAAGFEVSVAGPSHGPLAETLSARGFASVPWETQDASGARLPLGDLRTGLARIIAETGPDLIHANSLSTARIAGPLTAKTGRPSIGHLRDILKLTAQSIDDLNRHSRLLAVSHATRDFHIRQGLDPAKCFVLNNGVDLREFQPRPSKRYLHCELGLPATARLAAVNGQLGLRKGTDTALQAAREVAADAPDLHWVIVGVRTSNKPESHEFAQKLLDVASQLPLRGRVHFLAARQDVATLLNECTILVHAARQEPLGRVLLEAAASGLPVITTDVGGTREIFPTESDGGLLVPPDDPHQLATAILALIHDETRRRTIATGGRRRAESAFDIKTAAARLVQHYSDVLNGI